VTVTVTVTFVFFQTGREHIPPINKYGAQMNGAWLKRERNDKGN